VGERDGDDSLGATNNPSPGPQVLLLRNRNLVAAAVRDRELAPLQYSSDTHGYLVLRTATLFLHILLSLLLGAYLGF
jgi:hypothetical protein